jgi:hypothetical protein
MGGSGTCAACAASSRAVLANVGIMYPGKDASCPPITSPKSCRPLEDARSRPGRRFGDVTDWREGEVTGFRVGEVIEGRVGESVWSMLLLLAWLAFVALRAVRGGDVGAGCGRSRGFRLLNLCGP